MGHAFHIESLEQRVLLAGQAPIARPDLYVGYEDATFNAKNYYSSLNITGPGVSGGLRNWVPPIDAPGFSVSVDPTTGVLSASTPTTAAGPGWQLVLAPPAGSPLAVGTYDNAAIYPHQTAGHAGISFSSPALTSAAPTSGRFVLYYDDVTDRFAAQFELFSSNPNVPDVTGDVEYRHYDVLANDADPAGLAMTTAVVAGPSHGTLNLQTDGQFDYTPTNGFTGVDSFTYTSSSAGGTSDPAVATIHVLPTPTPTFVPGADQTAGTSSGPQLASPWLADLRAAAEITLHPLAFVTTADSNPSLFSAAPTVAAVNSGALTYTPAVGQSGSATITMVLRETDPVTGHTFDSAPHSFRISVSQPTDPPATAVDAYHVGENGLLSVTSPTLGVLANDRAAPAYTLSAVLHQGPSHGLLALGADGTFNYTPTTSFIGVDTFTYVAHPTAGPDSAPVTVTITVDLVNQPPVFTVGPDVTVDPNAGQVVKPNWATGISPGQPAEAGQRLTFYIAGQSNYDLLPIGSIAIDPDGTLRFTVPATSYGSDTITVYLQDGVGGNSAAKHFTITIVTIHGAPVAGDDVFETEVNQPLVVSATASAAATPQTWLWIDSPAGDPIGGGNSVLVTPSDADFFARTIASARRAAFSVQLFEPSNGLYGWSVDLNAARGQTIGTATYVADEAVSYDPGNGPAVRVVPEGDGTWPAQGSFTVLGVEGNFASPYNGWSSFAADFTQQALVNGQLMPAMTGRFRFKYTPPATVLANDAAGPDGAAPTSATLLTQPSHGTLAFNSDGSFTYTPVAGFVGTDSFTYTPGDGQLLNAPSTVNLIVAPARPQGRRSGTAQNVYPLSYPDANGATTASTPLAGWTVYNDANDNAQLDDGEVSAVTDLNGKYTLYLPGGDQLVRLVEQPGWATPLSSDDGTDVITAKPGDTGDLAALSTSMQNPTVIDVLAAYTDAARGARSSVAMSALASELFAGANRIFANSDTNVRINLVNVLATDYRQSGNLDRDLFSLAYPRDGLMDELPLARDQQHADLVVLLSADNTTSTEIGVAFEMTRSPYASALGYGVVALVDSTDKASDGDAATLAHEIGHNLGADHDLPNSFAHGIFPFAHGYNYTGAAIRHTLYQDVMSYGDGTVLPFFSTPRFTYDGGALGANNADNSLAVRLNAPAVARYRLGGDEATTKSPMLAITTILPRVAPVATSQALAGSAGNAMLMLVNGGDDVASGTAQVSLYLSSSSTTITASAPMKSLSVPLRLQPGGMRALPVRFNYTPGLANGTYYIIARIESAGPNLPVALAGQSVFVRSVDYAIPYVDLSLTIPPQPVEVNAGRPALIVVTVQNNGNVTFNAMANLQLHASSDSTLSDDDRLLFSRPIRIIRPRGAARAVVMFFRVPADLAAGNYSLIATITLDPSSGDNNAGDKQALGLAMVL